MLGGGEFAEIQRYQKDKKDKEAYLQENVYNLGYDADDFAYYMGYQKGKSISQIFR